ncbi:MAG TPA: cation diffusion facilitator family transporter [Gammaproteobacteria bacterium]|nr:cation diffusion facilitator family transporter [Gammaproteobacteria bacterium]
MHDHSHALHPEVHRSRPFVYALLLTLGFAVVEVIAGGWANSLALLGDAGHMVTDGIALGLAGLAAWVALKPASARHTYGFGRMEVMAALLNTLFMLVIVAAIAVEAVLRLRHPPAVQARVVMVIGVLGLIINIVVYKVLQHGDNSLNVRAALLHVLGDMLGSVAALLTGIVIYFTGWLPIDPLLSLFIAVLILISSLRLLRDAGQVLLEGVPRGLDLGEIGRSMAGVEGVRSVHDLHVWSLSSHEVSLSAHIVIEEMAGWQEILVRLRQYLHESYGIEHATLQPEAVVLARVPLESLTRRP